MLFAAMLAAAVNPPAHNLDGCTHFTKIDDATRNIGQPGFLKKCEKFMTKEGAWYRFTHPGNTMIPTRDPKGDKHCGAHAAGYQSYANPEVVGQITTGYMSFRYNTHAQYFKEAAKTKLCEDKSGKYFVYFLRKPPVKNPVQCQIRYCTTKDAFVKDRFSVLLGSSGQLPMRHLDFAFPQLERGHSTYFWSAMLTACSRMGMHPVCDYPPHCEKRDDLIKLASNNNFLSHFMNPSYKDQASYLSGFPEGAQDLFEKLKALKIDGSYARPYVCWHYTYSNKNAYCTTSNSYTHTSPSTGYRVACARISPCKSIKLVNMRREKGEDKLVKLFEATKTVDRCHTDQDDQEKLTLGTTRTTNLVTTLKLPAMKRVFGEFALASSIPLHFEDSGSFTLKDKFESETITTTKKRQKTTKTVPVWTYSTDKVRTFKAGRLYKFRLRRQKFRSFESWTANAQCIGDDGQVLSEKPIKGRFEKTSLGELKYSESNSRIGCAGHIATVPHSLRTDGYLFKFSVEARFKNAWKTQNYPHILRSSTDAFIFHGLGPVYGKNMGRVAIYIHTVKGLGSHGRGGGQTQTSKKLDVGKWYTITVEKTQDKLCIQVDKDAPNCAKRTVSRADFKMRPVGHLRWAKSASNMEGRNFKDLTGEKAQGGEE